MNPAEALSEKAYTELLTTLVRCVPSKRVAMVGLESPPAMHALVKGLRKACGRARDRADNPVGRFHVYCWPAGDWHDPEAVHRKLFDRDSRWRGTGRPRKQQPRFGVRDIVRYVMAGEGGVEDWNRSIVKFVKEGWFYGLIVHVNAGRKQDILADLDMLLPLCDDRTVLVMAHMDKWGASAAFRKTRFQERWDAVRIGDVALCSLAARYLKKDEVQ